jgi:Activator of Hsp90 ATPase homolog 1-like protein
LAIVASPEAPDGAGLLLEPNAKPNSDRSTVEFTPDGTGCLMTLTQEGIDIADELRQLPPGVEGGTEKGWNIMFDTLAAALW